jgi:hypothetical protein
MAAFQFQYSNLVMMIFKQIVILALIVMAFNFDMDSTRTNIIPNFLLPARVKEEPN